jgi:hypothetical protein
MGFTLFLSIDWLVHSDALENEIHIVNTLEKIVEFKKRG